MEDMTFRSWQDGDDLVLNQLWGDPESPAAAAARALFRPDSDDPVIRTVVALRDGLPVAAGYVAEASVHPGRVWTYVEVAREERREGLGSRLLGLLRERLDETRLSGAGLRAKAGVGSTGADFAEARGFEVLQRSTMVRIGEGVLPVPQPREPGTGGLEIDVVATGSVEVTEAFWTWYRHVHAWDPPAELGLGRVNALFLGPDSGARAAAVLRRDGVLRAFAISYPHEIPEEAAVVMTAHAESRADAEADPATELLVGLSIAEGREGTAQDVRDLLGQLAVSHPVVAEVDEGMPVLRDVVRALIDAGSASVAGETLVLGD